MNYDSRLFDDFMSVLEQLGKEKPILASYLKDCFLPLTYAQDIPEEQKDEFLYWYRDWISNSAFNYYMHRVG